MKPNRSTITNSRWAIGLIALLASCGGGASDPAVTVCAGAITRAMSATVARASRIIAGCADDPSTAGGAGGCLARALAAKAPGQARSAMGAELSRVLDDMSRQVLHACSGPDGKPYTADDVGGAQLNGAVPAVEFHPWGVESTAISSPAAYADARGSRFALEDGCLTTEPVDVWMQKPPLDRLIATIECMALSSAASLAQIDLRIVSETMEPVKSRIVPAGIVYDAGIDLLPLGAPDGINDTSAMPETTACGTPGVGYCADAPAVACSLAPGAGQIEDARQCPGSGLCIEVLNGPDGITLADVPSEQLDGGRCRVRFISPDPTDHSDAIAQVQCFVEGVRDRDGRLVTSDFSGHCNDGPVKDLPCSGNRDCNPDGGTQFSCISGDEHVCEFDGVRISNPDNIPACGDECVGILVPGPKSVSCGQSSTQAGTEGICFISRCVGGDRDGQLCAGNCDDRGCASIPGYGHLVCTGGGTCLNLGKRLPYSGDEVGFYFRNLGGMGYTLCPVAFRWDTPFDVLDGAGWVTQELTRDPINLCAPAGTAIQAMGCWVHEPAEPPSGQLAAVPYAGTARFGINFYTGQTTQGSSDGLPCPNAGLVIPSNVLGVPFQIGIGPVIGVSGSVAP